MIDLTTPIRKSSVLEPLNRHEYNKVDSAFSNNHFNMNSNFPDVARRIISSSPAAYVAMAFAVGGIFGWLTSRR